MKNCIIKIWVCDDCGKESLDRPVVCSMCNCFGFYVKYGGQITDDEELVDLIDSYKKDETEKNKKVRL